MSGVALYPAAHGRSLDGSPPARRHGLTEQFVDETYVKVSGRWIYLYSAIGKFGQVIDVMITEKRDLAAARRFFTCAPCQAPQPAQVITDRATAYPRVLDELLPAACHVVEPYANNPVEADQGRLKSRLRPMRGLRQLHCARMIATGHVFVENIRRGHYELGVKQPTKPRVVAAFTELAVAI